MLLPLTLVLVFNCLQVHAKNIYSAAPLDTPRLNINVTRSSDNSFADGVVAVFNNTYSSGIGAEDASKFTNFSETFSLVRNGQPLSIEGRPLVAGKDTLFFSMVNFSKRTYDLVIAASGFAGVTAILEDRYLAAQTVLDLTGNTTYNFTVNNDAESSAANRFVITFVNTSFYHLWQGNVDGDWSNAANWANNSVPTASSNILIPAVFTNTPSIADFNLVAGASLEIGAGGILNIRDSAVLSVSGAVINNGTIDGLGSLTLNGTTLQTISGIGIYNTLELNNAAGATIPASNTVSVTNIYTPKAGMLTNNGSFVLKSSAAITAEIAAGTGSYFAGNVTVERFIPSNNRKSYTMVTSPVNAPAMYNAWQEGGALGNGYGTQITGPTGHGASDGFDGVSASGLASVFQYNDANPSGSKWVSLTNTNVNTLAPGKGYLLYVRGDRTITPATPTGSDATLRATGTLTTGDVTFNTLTPGAGSFSLIANPYPSAINWLSRADGITPDISLTDVDDAFYVYDPVLKVFVTFNGSVLSPSGSTQPTKYLQSGQAFFVKANGANPSVTFREIAKVHRQSATANTVFDVKAAKPQLNINVYSAGDNSFADGAVALFDNSFKVGVAKEDAAKLANFNENISFVRNNEKLSIEGRPLVSGNDTLFLHLSNFSKKEYTLNIDGNRFAGTTATLFDKFTNTQQAIDLAGTTTYKFTINSEAASAASDRFVIAFGSTATTVTDNVADNELFVKISPNPIKDQLQIRFKTTDATNTVIKVINNLGQIVRTVNAGKVNAGNFTISASSLPAGLYTVQLISGDSKIATQKIVKQ